ncbi:MAG: squalene synthase HpnC [Rhodoferax sp.]|nr:squalene synthase HpnC [Rhodoferax sp.]
MVKPAATPNPDPAPRRQPLQALQPVQAIDHYENFPVASWLCPRALRAPVVALYHFARTADDLADEGDAPADQRLADLGAYREALQIALQGQPPQPGSRWAPVFAALAAAVRSHRLPAEPLHHLLDAFEQDVRYTQAGQRYADLAELRAYCARSANPVGRLLLHLYGVADATALARSDHICTALQLINFWQDLGVDLARNRCYLPLQDCQRHGCDAADLLQRRSAPQAIQLIAHLSSVARLEMQKGLDLVHQIPGRAGWELRLVVQGGLRVLDRIEALGFNTLSQRPTLRRRDLPVMLWRALAMGVVRPQPV